MAKQIQEAMEYAYKNKNGLKSEFIEKFGEETFNSLFLTGMIYPCQRVSGNDSWKITKSGYDWYVVTHPEVQYKHWTTKVQDFVNYWIYFRWMQKEHEVNSKIKEAYFK